MLEDHFYVEGSFYVGDHFNVGGSFICRRVILMSDGHFFVIGSF